jgi:hypothetical protein
MLHFAQRLVALCPQRLGALCPHWCSLPNERTLYFGVRSTPTVTPTVPTTHAVSCKQKAGMPRHFEGELGDGGVC